MSAIRRVLAVSVATAAMLGAAAAPSSAVVGGNERQPGRVPGGRRDHLRPVPLHRHADHARLGAQRGPLRQRHGRRGRDAGQLAAAAHQRAHRRRQARATARRARVSQVVVAPELPAHVGLRHLAAEALAAARRWRPRRWPARASASIWTAGTLETIVGWGATEEGGEHAGQPSGGAACRSRPTRTARGAYSDFDAKTMVCAGFPQGGVDTCQGDSGGPMFGETSAGALRVVGTTSFGEGCARPGRPGVYGRVADDTLRPWIAETTGGRRQHRDEHAREQAAAKTRRARSGVLRSGGWARQAPPRRQQQRPPSLEHERDQEDDQDDQQERSDTDIHGTPFLASDSSTPCFPISDAALSSERRGCAGFVSSVIRSAVSRPAR